MPTSNIPSTLPNEAIGPPMFGETWGALMLLIKNQPSATKGIRITSQMNPALWMSGVGAGRDLADQRAGVLHEHLGRSTEHGAVMTSGIKSCIVVTPALPIPAFSPSARPCILFG